MDAQFELMEKRAKDIIRETNIMCSKDQIGRMEMVAKKFIYRRTAVLSLFYNIEAWTNLRQMDEDRLEVIQGKVLKGIFGLPKSTPYWGILSEFKILPIKLLITYRKLMLYHNMINSDNKRVSKQVIQQQEKLKHDKCWFGNTRDDAEKIGIHLKEQLVKDVTKSSWKKVVKDAVGIAFENQINQEKTRRKLRFIGRAGVDSYITANPNVDIRKALMIRLNMTEFIGDNYGGKTLCALCVRVWTTLNMFFSAKGV